MMFDISYPSQGESPASLTDAFELATQLAFDHVALPGAFIDRIEKTRSVEFVTTFRRAARGHDLMHSFHRVSSDPVLLGDGRLDVDGVQRVFFALNLERLVGAAFVVTQPMPLGEY